MSLQIWLPLIDSIENKGLSDCTLTTNNLTYDTTGKFYKSGLFSSTYIAIDNTPLNTSTKEFSFCFWLYTTSASSTQCLYNGRTSVGGAIAIFILEGKVRFDDGSQHTFSSYKVPQDVWVHYAITRNEDKVCLYINGSLVETQTSTAFTCTATKASIGVSSVNAFPPNSGNNIIGKLNDYRIYDNCLSAREVKEISKGCILHLPLNQPERNKNYVKTEDVFNLPSSNYLIDNNACGGEVTCTLGNVDSYVRMNLIENLVAGKTYTLSFDCERISESSNITYVVNSSANSGLKLKNGRCSLTFSPNESGSLVTSKMIVFDDNNRTYATSQVPFTLKRFKVEEGSIATEYCPSPNDSLTWTDGIEYDCSGFSNNGTVYGNLSLCKDTPRYEYGYTFGNDAYITCPDTVKTHDELTISIWAYMSDWSTANSSMRLFSCTESSGYNIEWYTNGEIQFPVNVTDKGYVNNVGSVKWTQLSSGWHHFVGTFDGIKTALYLDGVKIASNTTGLTVKKPIKYIANGLHIHGEATSTIGSVGKNTNVMNLSDARIYAKALTEEEILELYNKPVSITNTGTLMTQGEVKEIWK